jgi:hypothetical protein
MSTAATALFGEVLPLLSGTVLQEAANHHCCWHGVAASNVALFGWVIPAKLLRPWHVQPHKLHAAVVLESSRNACDALVEISVARLSTHGVEIFLPN